MKVAPESTSLTAGSGVLSRTAHTGILLLSSSLHVLYINPERFMWLSAMGPNLGMERAIRAYG